MHLIRSSNKFGVSVEFISAASFDLPFHTLFRGL